MGFDPKKGSPTRVLAKKIILASWLVDPESGFWPQKRVPGGVTHSSTSQKKLFSYLGWLTRKMAFRLRRCGPIILMSKYLTGSNQTDRTLWINFGGVRSELSTIAKKIIFISWLVDPETGQLSHLVSWSQIPFWTSGSTSAGLPFGFNAQRLYCLSLQYWEHWSYCQ